MKITVAGERKEYDEGLTVSKLIEIENVETPESEAILLKAMFSKKGTKLSSFTSWEEADNGIYQRTAGKVFQTYYS